MQSSNQIDCQSGNYQRDQYSKISNQLIEKKVKVYKNEIFEAVCKACQSSNYYIKHCDLLGSLRQSERYKKYIYIFGIPAISGLQICFQKNQFSALPFCLG